MTSTVPRAAARPACLKSFVPPANRIPNFVGPGRDGVGPDALERPDRRHVQRVLERLPDEDRAAIELVRVARRPAGCELVGDVEEEAARGQPLRVEGARVDDRLPRRARLPDAVAGGVVLRLELAARDRVAVVAGAPDVGADVAGPVVDRDQRPVVEVLAAEGVDPGPVRRADLQVSQERRGGLPREVRGDRAGGQPLLGELLGAPVERRDHRVAAGLDRRVGAEDLLELASDLPREVRRPEGQRLVAGEDDRLGQGLLELGVRELGPARASRGSRGCSSGGRPAGPWPGRRAGPSRRAWRSCTGRSSSATSGGPASKAAWAGVSFVRSPTPK